MLELLISMDSVALLGGIFGLYLGAEFLVDGASSLALQFGIRATTVGVTIVAFATTAPELIVSTTGGLTESDSIALGNILGSNIANIGLVLGMSAVAYPMEINRNLVRKHGPFMLAAALGLVVLSVDRKLGATDGMLLLGLLLIYTIYLLRGVAGDTEVMPEEFVPESDVDSNLRKAVKLFLAVGFLYVGSRGLIAGGTGLLREIGFGDLFIGLTIIALGTSTPELATSLVSAYREGAAFSVGNVIGSNIYNILAVIGVVALIVPIRVSADTTAVELPLLVVFTLGALVLLGFKRRLSRMHGLVLVSSYASFIAVLLVTR